MVTINLNCRVKVITFSKFLYLVAKADVAMKNEISTKAMLWNGNVFLSSWVLLPLKNQKGTPPKFVQVPARATNL